MTVPKRRDIEESLTRGEVPPPPAGLLERLREDVPERLSAPEAERWQPIRSGVPSRRSLLAASAAMAIGAGVLAYVALRDGRGDLAPRSGATIGAETASADSTPPPPRPRAGAPEDGIERQDRKSAAEPAEPKDYVLQQVRTKPPAVQQQTELPQPKAQRVPRPDPAPGEPDPIRLPKEVESRVDLPDTDLFFDVPEGPPEAERRRYAAPLQQRTELSEVWQRREPGYVVPPSTGGTAEPNDQPYGDVFFRSSGVNPFVDTEDDRLSTFGLDVDTGSYGIARRYLEDAHLPPPEAIRVEEFVNAFSYGDEAPRGGEDFALHAEGAPTPFAENERYHLLRFAVRAREVAAEERLPAVLTFVVDVSGSMEREDRLGLVQEALRLLIDELRGDDRVGLVVYGGDARAVLEPTSDHGAVRAAIERLVPEGSTNAEAGLVLGYEMAERSLRRGAINRVILCSDGVANVGATGPASILARIGEAARRGIELTTVGFGMGNYNDVLMEQLADRGDGRYAYVDDLAEARRIFVEELTGTLQTVAAEAKAQVEFDPAVVSRYRLLGYENRDIADEDFRDDRVDAGEIGAGHGVTALYEVKLREGAPAGAPAATLRLRYRSLARDEIVEQTLTLSAGDLERGWSDASPALRLAAVVAELAEILKESYWAREADPDELLRRAQAVSAEFPGDERVAELAALAGRVAALRRAR